MLDSQSWGKTILRNVVGFTLAEVLITIAVIGVIAAIVIPSLLKNTNGRETVVALNKYQSVFSEAIKRYMVDNGCNGDLSICSAFTGNLDQAGANQLGTALAPYFSIQKNCGTAAGQGCFVPGVMYKYLNNTDNNIRDDQGQYKVKLNDGASMFSADNDGNCNTDYSAPSNPSSPIYKNVCGYLAVDINGYKGPNKWGRDTFLFNILKTGQVIPGGVFDAATRGCDPNSSDVTQDDDGAPGTGYGCTYKVLQEGAVNY